MINVVGLGYIGLPTSLALAANGYKVVGTDIDEKIVNKLSNNEVTFKEEGLPQLMDKARLNNIEFLNNYVKTDFYIIAVPTPFNKTSKKIDASYLIKAVDDVVAICENESIIVIESTVSPGTINNHVKPIAEKYNKKINFVHAPERILPGNMIKELENNSRTIGADSKEIANKVKNVYTSFCKGNIITTDIKTAEMTKVVENTYRDINIAFANELAKLCNRDNMDVYEIINIANNHPRVNILNPGPGVGGHCISVDPWFLVGDYPDLTKLISAARLVNDSMPNYVLDRLREIMKNENIDSISKVGIYGLTYKPDVDDLRNSPSTQLLNLLDEEEANLIKKYDPMVNREIFSNQYLDFEKFVNDVDLVLVMVEHSQIIEEVNNIKGKIIFDTKNCIKNYPTYKI